MNFLKRYMPRKERTGGFDMNESYGVTSKKIEITSLVEVLQEIVEDGQKVFFSKKVMVDKDELTSVLDELTQALPEDLRTAQWVLSEKDRILNEARSEYERSKAEVAELMKAKLDNHDLVKEAEVRAKEIIAKAQSDAKMVRLSARDYADNLLTDLEKELQSKNSEMMVSLKKLFEGFISDYNRDITGTAAVVRENIKELREMK